MGFEDGAQRGLALGGVPAAARGFGQELRDDLAEQFEVQLVVAGLVRTPLPPISRSQPRFPRNHQATRSSPSVNRGLLAFDRMDDPAPLQRPRFPQPFHFLDGLRRVPPGDALGMLLGNQAPV